MSETDLDWDVEDDPADWEVEEHEIIPEDHVKAAAEHAITTYGYAEAAAKLVEQAREIQDSVNDVISRAVERLGKMEDRFENALARAMIAARDAKTAKEEVVTALREGKQSLEEMRGISTAIQALTTENRNLAHLMNAPRKITLIRDSSGHLTAATSKINEG